MKKLSDNCSIDETWLHIPYFYRKFPCYIKIIYSANSKINIGSIKITVNDDATLVMYYHPLNNDFFKFIYNNFSKKNFNRDQINEALKYTDFLLEKAFKLKAFI